MANGALSGVAGVGGGVGDAADCGEPRAGRMRRGHIGAVAAGGSQTGLLGESAVIFYAVTLGATAEGTYRTELTIDVDTAFRRLGGRAVEAGRGPACKGMPFRAVTEGVVEAARSRTWGRGLGWFAG